MGLLCCTVTASRGITALAAGAEVETDGVQEDVEAEKAVYQEGDKPHL